MMDCLFLHLLLSQYCPKHQNISACVIFCLFCAMVIGFPILLCLSLKTKQDKLILQAVLSWTFCLTFLSLWSLFLCQQLEAQMLPHITGSCGEMLLFNQIIQQCCIQELRYSLYPLFVVKTNTCKYLTPEAQQKSHYVLKAVCFP